MTDENESGSEGKNKIKNKKLPHNDTPIYQQILEDLKNEYDISEEMYNLINRNNS